MSGLDTAMHIQCWPHSQHQKPLVVVFVDTGVLTSRPRKFYPKPMREYHSLVMSLFWAGIPTHGEVPWFGLGWFHQGSASGSLVSRVVILRVGGTLQRWGPGRWELGHCVLAVSLALPPNLSSAHADCQSCLLSHHALAISLSLSVLHMLPPW